MKPFWAGLLILGLASPHQVAAYTGMGASSPAMRGGFALASMPSGSSQHDTHPWSSGGMRDQHPWHEGHDGWGPHRHFVRYVYLAPSYYPQAVDDSSPDYDSEQGNGSQTVETRTVYYEPSPPPPQARPASYAPAVAASPKVPMVPAGPPRVVHGTLWKYSVGGVNTYTNVKPPANTGAKQMFSYTESCAASCTYASDN